ncbi:MAG TPA: hypothetical protein VE152_14520, partial [Acidimicrobiales bacterium]|nr:hypothetical protein [Acidimicrobiales bacterium]
VHVPAHDGQPPVTYGEEVQDLAQELATGVTGSWDAFAKVLYAWDGEIQDGLASGASSVASGYQLGRGLAETFWALDPHAPDGDASSWTELFRPDRVTVLSRLLGRFSPYCQPVSAPAVAGSLKIWAAVAADRVWREESDAHSRLRASVRSWFSLLVLDQDPETMVKPYAWLKNYRTTGKIIRMFAPQLIAILIGVALLTAAGVLVSSGSGGTAAQAVLGALGVLGLSAATLQAGAKSAAQSLLARIRQDTYIDLIAAEVSSVPRVPRQQRLLPAKQATEHRVRKELCRRELTGSLPDGR